MILADPTDQHRVVNILTAAFDTNKSVNYIAREGKRRLRSIRALMAYSFKLCMRYGRVYLSEDRKACALLLYPDKKQFSFTSLLLDLQLIFGCVGLGGVPKTLRREAIIKRQHPAKPFAYLWFIGVEPTQQKNGIGSRLLQEVITESKQLLRQVYLETSTAENLPWYKKMGFEVYHTEDLGYLFYFLKHETGINP